MNALSAMIRDMAVRVAAKEKYKIEEVKIFFSAPAPEKVQPSDQELGASNFQWTDYAVLFIDEEGNFYFYQTPLQPWGAYKTGGQQVVVSDSVWSVDRSRSAGIEPDEIERVFRGILKKPDLQPPRVLQVVYVNTHKTDKLEDYSLREFQREFEESGLYTVQKNNQLYTPYGKPIGRVPEEKS